MNDPEVPENLILNFSRGARPAQRSEIDFTRQKYSEVVPTEVWEDLITSVPTGRMVRNRRTGAVKPEMTKDWTPPAEKSIAEMKRRLAAKYGVDANAILTYEEMLKTPIGRTGQYHVVVRPKADGDASANRRDVQITFLLIH